MYKCIIYLHVYQFLDTYLNIQHFNLLSLIFIFIGIILPDTRLNNMIL